MLPCQVAYKTMLSKDHHQGLTRSLELNGNKHRYRYFAGSACCTITSTLIVEGSLLAHLQFLRLLPQKVHGAHRGVLAQVHFWRLGCAEGLKSAA